jgi:O-methyltransferase
MSTRLCPAGPPFRLRWPAVWRSHYAAPAQTIVRRAAEMIQSAVRGLFRSLGYDIVRRDYEFSPNDVAIMRRVEEFTMTSRERLFGLINAVRYLSTNGIDGSFMECGVWRGGSTMAAVLTLMEEKNTARDIYLFDTFEGMSAPTEKDVVASGETAENLLKSTSKGDGANVWAIAGLDDVQRNLFSTGYPRERLYFIKGKVEDTIPLSAPQEIALLRLDTDWYESTRHELVHLFPRLKKNGVLIIDDYGHWKGARQAVDEFLAAQPFKPLLTRLDYTGRLLIKTT